MGTLASVWSTLIRLKQSTEPLGIALAEALALLVLALGALALTGMVWWTTRPVPLGTPSPEPLSLQGSVVPQPLVDPPPTGDVVVHVVGAVRTPGLVTLPSGSRVADAIDAAGGLGVGASVLHLNLARTVVDGEQVVVPLEGEEPPAVVPGASSGTEEPVDLNTATLEDLQGLPGVGPVTGQRILDHRQTIGGFVDVAQLLEVPGIGPARFADLQSRVRV